MTEHEYSIVGHSRAHVGRYLGIASGITATVLTSFYVVVMQHIRAGGMSTAEVITVPLFGGILYAGLHFVFDRWLWRWQLVRKAMGLPDIEGTWNCVGLRHDNGEGEQGWGATVTIKQTWEKISIALSSATGSESFSKGASLLKRSDGKFVLMYSYKNSGLFADDTLRPHVGYCELVFTENPNSAEGYYFNNNGRVTYGKMTLTKQLQGQ